VTKANPLVMYLYSTKNLAGLGGALVGLGLFFGGIVGPIWPGVVAGLYAAGALAAPSRKVADLSSTFDPKDIEHSLERQWRAVQGKLPSDVLAQVANIQQTILQILPRTSTMSSVSPEMFIVERTAKDYLPAALEAYMALPRAYAATRKNSDGKTPKQLLSEQLELLDNKLTEIADNVSKDDLDKLEANGKFLEERFGRSALDLPPQP
jgi:hypothetical protein